MNVMRPRYDTAHAMVCRPYRGSLRMGDGSPRLAPWANFWRRYAANAVGLNKLSGLGSGAERRKRIAHGVSRGRFMFSEASPGGAAE
jgi:hypothetical protein